MEQWQKWKKTEPHRLACYVNVDAAVEEFGAPRVDADLRRDRLAVVRRIYQYLAAESIPYDTSRIDFAAYREAEQYVRDPAEVRANAGNCLELAFLFAALCQHAKLRPLLVLLENHAMVAVRLDEDSETFAAEGRPGEHDHELFSGGLLPPASDPHVMAAKLAEWVTKSRCVVIECTGVATGTSTLSFEDALRKGADQLNFGALTQLVDVTYLHLRQGSPYQPYAVRARVAPSAPPATLGEAAQDAVYLHLDRLDPAPAPPARWDARGLRAMRATVPEQEPLGQVLAALCDVLAAADFARGWMPRALTSRRLRSALPAYPRPQPGEGATDADYLAHVVLHRPATQKDWRPVLVRYLVAVALNAGMNVRDQDFVSWTYRLLREPLTANDLLDAAEKRSRTTRWRLRISLHGSPTGRWPESVMAWLSDGDGPPEPKSVKCEPTRQSVESAIAELLEWASDRAEDARDRLRRVEIAVPTSLLVEWRPEETKQGSRIGMHHDVVMRWSERLNPPAHLRRQFREAPRRWEYIDEHGAGGGLDWLGPDDARDIDTLREQLADGTYQGAVGLRFLPERREDLLETVLLFSPVLLWPTADTCGWDGIDLELRARWESLPTALADAYRSSWTRRGEVSPLAVVRAVWDDHEWLMFCRNYLKSPASFRRAGG